jgi:hypothetical protein
MFLNQIAITGVSKPLANGLITKRYTTRETSKKWRGKENGG